MFKAGRIWICNHTQQTYVVCNYSSMPKISAITHPVLMNCYIHYFHGLIQKRCNCSANALYIPFALSSRLQNTGLNSLVSAWYWRTIISMVSCQKGPTRHAYAWQIGPLWQDTLDIFLTFVCNVLLARMSRVWGRLSQWRSPCLGAPSLAPHP